MLILDEDEDEGSDSDEDEDVDVDEWRLKSDGNRRSLL